MLRNQRTIRFVFSGLSVLFLLLISCSAYGQMNNLSDTEKANVTLVINNLKKLVTDGQATLPQNPGSDDARALKDAAKKELDKLDEVRRNLEAKLAGGNIHSVPGLKRGQPKKYKHNGDPLGSPTAAYCDDQTSIRNGKNWVPCPDGDIIVDSGTIDPGHGQAIDEGIADGWKLKWTLLHVLVHEKMHELMINEQLARLRAREDWDGRSDEQKKAAIEKAKEEGSTPGVHQQVYEWQKNALRWERRVLEAQLDALSKQKPPNHADMNKLKAKINWLKAQVSDLEEKMAKATGGNEFVIANCHLPGVDWKKLTRVYVGTDGLYWRLDVQKRKSGILMNIGESNWLGQIVAEHPMAGKVAQNVVISEGAFSAARIQPGPCEYLLKMARPDDLHVVSSMEALYGALRALTGLTPGGYRSEQQQKPKAKPYR